LNGLFHNVPAGSVSLQLGPWAPEAILPVIEALLPRQNFSFTFSLICLYLFRDNIPAILLGEWDLSAEYFDEDFLSGIMPVLFARDPKAAESGIRSNPETAMKDLDKLNRIFFIPESVELLAAQKIVKRARMGDVDYVFKRKNLERVFEPETFIQGN
jgi:hypothetical protein